MTEKNINQTTFNFAEESPGRGSEDIKKDCNINCFDFLILFSLSDGRHGRKNHNKLEKNGTKIEK